MGIQTHLIIQFDDVKIVSYDDRPDKMLFKVVKWPTQEKKKKRISSQEVTGVVSATKPSITNQMTKNNGDDKSSVFTIYV